MKTLTEIQKEMVPFEIGKMTISTGFGKEKLWIMNEEGEGGDFPIEDIEKILNDYFNKNF